MSELVAIGISHKTAPVALRERLSLTEREAERLMRELIAHEAVREAVAISTCNRTEVYVVVSDSVQAESRPAGQARHARRDPPDGAGRASSTRRATATPLGTCSASPRGSSR